MMDFSILNTQHRFEIPDGYFFCDPDGIWPCEIILYFGTDRAKIEFWDNKDYVGCLEFFSRLFIVPEVSKAYENNLKYKDEIIEVLKDSLQERSTIQSQHIQRMEAAIGNGFSHYLNRLNDLERATEKLKKERAELERVKTEIKKSKPNNNYGFVYLFHNTENDSYKIGLSKDPEKRLGAIKTSLSSDVEMILSIETGDMVSLESYLHDRFKDRRIRGEWFKLTKEDVDYIKSL